MDGNYKRIKKRQQEHEKYDSVPAVFFFYKEMPLFYRHFQHSSNTAGSSFVHGFQTSAPAPFGLPVFMKFTQYTSIRALSINTAKELSVQEASEVLRSGNAFSESYAGTDTWPPVRLPPRR